MAFSFRGLRRVKADARASHIQCAPSRHWKVKRKIEPCARALRTEPDEVSSPDPAIIKHARDNALRRIPVMSRLSHSEVHMVHRVGWLRAAVLGGE